MVQVLGIWCGGRTSVRPSERFVLLQNKDVAVLGGYLAIGDLYDIVSIREACIG